MKSSNIHISIQYIQYWIFRVVLIIQLPGKIISKWMKILINKMKYPVFNKILFKYFFFAYDFNSIKKSDKMNLILMFFSISFFCRFQIDKRCQNRCSWKCFSIALILLSIVLTVMVAYFASKYQIHQIIIQWQIRKLNYENWKVT